MSKFFAGGDSSSEESESDSDSEPEIMPNKIVAAKGRAAIIDSDSDSDEEQRVVMSHKDKAHQSMQEGILKIKNSMKTNDWSVIYDEYVKVNALMEKAKAKSGIPTFYVKMLGDLNDFVNTTLKDKEAVKKMRKPIAHSLNQMKLSIRKVCDKYRVEVDDYKENPDKYKEDIATPKAPTKKKAGDSDSDSDSDSDDDSDSDSGSESSSGGGDSGSDVRPFLFPPFFPYVCVYCLFMHLLCIISVLRVD